MAFKRQLAKGRREGGPFVPIPCSVLDHENFLALSGKASKLLLDMAAQIRFGKDGPKNNGDITIAWSVMQQRGWRSKETLHNAIDELEYYGFISLTRQGGRHKCSLYAITWWAVNECGGKLDSGETRVPSNDWKTAKEPRKPAKRRSSKSKSVPRLSVIGAPSIGAIKSIEEER